MKALALALALSGCALTSKGTPLEVRYFSPEEVEATRAVPPPDGRAGTLRLGRVSSSANLRARIVHRDSELELSEYQTLRWTEDPQAYVQRSLLRALFEDGRLRQAVGGSAPTLDVELTAFEEVRRGSLRAGRVQLRYLVRDEQLVLTRGVVTIERAAAAAGIEPVVAAIADALRDAAHALTGVVAERLRPLELPASPGPLGP